MEKSYRVYHMIICLWRNWRDTWTYCPQAVGIFSSSQVIRTQLITRESSKEYLESIGRPFSRTCQQQHSRLCWVTTSSCTSNLGRGGPWHLAEMAYHLFHAVKCRWGAEVLENIVVMIYKAPALKLSMQRLFIPDGLIHLLTLTL